METLLGVLVLVLAVLLIAFWIIGASGSKQAAFSSAQESTQNTGDSSTFKATYVGGHSLYPKTQGAYVSVGSDHIAVRGYGSEFSSEYLSVGFNVPFKRLTRYGVATKNQVDAGAVVLLGITGFLFRKDEPFLYLKFTDRTGQEQTPAFFFDMNPAKLQQCVKLIADRRGGVGGNV